jgi:hypothetical protein
LQISSIPGTGKVQAADTPLLSGEATSAARARTVAPLAPQPVAPAADVQGDAARQSRMANATVEGRLRAPGLQLNLGKLQQGLLYVAQLGTAVQDLKTGLQQALSDGESSGHVDVQPKLDAVRLLWRARGALSGGRLDAQLQLVPEGAVAQQHFRIRGLDADSLSRGGAETLRWAVPGQPRAVVAYLDGQGLAGHVQSLQRAMASAGVSVRLSGDQLDFRVAESAWPALRDGLSLRGDGKRFPSGQMVRAPLDAVGDGLVSSAWRVDDEDGQRQCLAALAPSQDKLARVRQSLAQALNQASAMAPASGDGMEVARFAAAFAQGVNEVDAGDVVSYGRLAELAPALKGLHRQQVEQVITGPRDE